MARWLALPWPNEAMVIAPGFSRARATSSAMLAAGRPRNDETDRLRRYGWAKPEAAMRHSKTPTNARRNMCISLMRCALPAMYSRWRVGDLAIWDNLATMHRGRPFDDAVASCGVS